MKKLAARKEAPMERAIYVPPGRKRSGECDEISCQERGPKVKGDLCSARGKIIR